MAVFNPGVPDMQPKEYLNYSKPISDIAPDKSAATLISGLGDVMQQGAGLADTLLKQKIQADIYDQVDPKREEMNQGLAAQRQALLNVGGNPNVDTSTIGTNTGTSDSTDFSGQKRSKTGEPLNILPDTTAPVVPAIQNGLDKAAVIENSRKNNQGNISMSYYDGQLDAIAKNMRAQWPMYREFIDQQMSAITGKNPANALIQSQMSDINNMVRSQASNTNNQLNYIRNHAMPWPGGNLIYEGVKNGTIAPEVGYAFINAAEGSKNMRDLDKANFELKDYKDKDYAQTAADNLTKNWGSLVSNRLYSIDAVDGMTNPGNVIKRAQDAIANKTPMTDQQAQSYAAQIGAIIEDASREMDQEAHKPVKPGGRTYAQALTTDEYNKRKIAALAPLKEIQDNLLNKDVGLASNNSRTVQNMEKYATLHLYEGNFGSKALMMKALSGSGNQFYNEYLTRQMQTSLTSGLSELSQETELKAFTQPGLAKGNVATVNQAISKAEAVQVNADKYGPDAGKYFKGIGDIPKVVMSKTASDGIKENAIRFGFAPDSTKMLLKIPDTGLNSGRFALYKNYTSPEYAKEVKRIAGANPDLIDQHKSWVGESMGILANTKIKDLNAYSQDPSVMRKVGLSYDDTTGQFVVKSLTAPGATNYYYNEVKKQTDLINTAIQGARNVFQVYNPNGDPNVFVGELLAKNGYGENVSPGILNKAWDTFTSTKYNKKDSSVGRPTPPQVSPPTPAALNYTDENKAPTVSDFFKNPTGAIKAEGNTPERMYHGTGGIKGNLSDWETNVVDVQDIPYGVDPVEYARQLKAKGPR